MKVGDLVRIGSGTARIMAGSKESQDPWQTNWQRYRNEIMAGSKESCIGMIIEIDSDNWAQILLTKPRVESGCSIGWTPIIMCQAISES